MRGLKQQFLKYVFQNIAGMIGISIYSEGDPLLAEHAHGGLCLYFLGYLLEGVNIMLVTYFSATDRGLSASVASILRGVVAVVICAVFLAWLWGMNGIWMSFLTAEGITLIMILGMIWLDRNRQMQIENIK